MTTPNPLDREALRRAVRSAGIDAAPRWFDSIGSTNTEAIALARGGAPEWTVVAAGHQTEGRGRLGRSWTDAPGGSLLFSVILRPSVEPSRAPLLTLLAAVEMIEACGVPAMRSKWPNDLLVDDRKVGGILAEAELVGPRVDHVVVGVGLNVARWHGAPPSPVASSLIDAGAGSDMETVLARFLSSFRSSYQAPSFPDVVLRRYAAVSSTLGRDVRATTIDGRTVEGRAVEIDPRGGLVVDSHGRREIVAFGEVEHLR